MPSRWRKKYFGRIPRGKADAPDVVTLEVKQLAEKRMNAEAEANPQLDILWHTVPFGHRDSYALDILAEICPRARGGFTRGWCSVRSRHGSQRGTELAEVGGQF